MASIRSTKSAATNVDVVKLSGSKVKTEWYKKQKRKHISLFFQLTTFFNYLLIVLDGPLYAMRLRVANLAAMSPDSKSQHQTEYPLHFSR